MPKLDRTFTGMDIIRIWQDHLDSDEQERVLCFFRSLSEAQDLQGDLDENILDLVLSLIGLVPGAGDLINIVIQALFFADSLLEIADGLATPSECLQSILDSNPGLPALL